MRLTGVFSENRTLKLQPERPNPLPGDKSWLKHRALLDVCNLEPPLCIAKNSQQKSPSAGLLEKKNTQSEEVCYDRLEPIDKTRLLFERNLAKITRGKTSDLKTLQKTDHESKKAGLFDNLLPVDKTCVGLSPHLNMNSAKKLMMTESPENLNSLKLTMLDLCQGCRSVGISQSSFDKFTEQRRYRRVVNTTFDLAQMFASDLVDNCLKKRSPITSRFSLTHICPVDHSGETVPVIDNDFISAPCCFTALYQFNSWKRKVISPLEAAKSNNHKANPITKKIEDYVPGKSTVNKIKAPSRSKLSSRSKGVQVNCKDEFVPEKIFIDQNFSEKFAELPSPKRKSVRIANGDTKRCDAPKSQLWPWEVNVSSKTAYHMLKGEKGEYCENQTKRKSSKNQKNTYPKGDESFRKISPSKQSDNQSTFDRKSEKLLNYSFEDSDTRRTENRTKASHKELIMDDKWPWEDEAKVSQYLQESFDYLDFRKSYFINEEKEVSANGNSTAEFMKTDYTLDNQDSSNWVLSDDSCRELSSEETVQSLPCRAPLSKLTANSPFEGDLKTQKRSSDCIREIPRCHMNSPDSELSSSTEHVHNTSGTTQKSSSRIDLKSSLSDIERASSNVELGVVKNQTSQNVSYNCSRQSSQDIKGGEISKLVKLFETDELLKSRLFVKNTVVYPVEVDVHDESQSAFKQFLPCGAVKCFSPLKGELINEFYDLPPFETSYRNSIESLYSTLSGKQSKNEDMGFLKKAFAASAASLSRDCDSSLLKDPRQLKTFEDESPKPVSASASLEDCKLKYSENMMQSHESIASQVNSKCFGNNLPSASSFRGIKKAARNLFRKLNSSSESFEKANLSRYMSFVNDKENWLFDPNDTILRDKGPESGTTNDVLSTFLGETKVTQTDFSDSDIGCALDSALEVSAVSTASQHFKETQTEFSPDDSSRASLDSEEDTKVSRTSQTSGIYFSELNKCEVEANVPENIHSTLLGETTATEAYFSNNTLPFTEAPTDYEDGLGLTECDLLSNENSILPDMHKRIDNVESVLNDVVSRFTCLDDVLNSYQQTIKDMPSGSASDISLSTSRMSFEKVAGAPNLNILKRGNYKLSPLSSPSRKKDRLKDSIASIADIPEGRLSTSTRRALHSTPTLPESSEVEDMLDDSTKENQKELMREIQLRNLRASLGARKCSWDDDTSVGSEDVFLAPLAASESIATINSAKLSQSFQQESFLEENRNSSFKTVGSDQGDVVSSGNDGSEDGLHNYGTPSEGLKSDQSSSEVACSDMEQLADYEEQYNDIKLSYQNLSALNYAFMDNSDTAENDSLNVYGIDPCNFNADAPINKNTSSSSDSYHSPEGSWTQMKEPKMDEPDEENASVSESLQQVPSREEGESVEEKEPEDSNISGVLGEMMNNQHCSRSQTSSVDLDDSESPTQLGSNGDKARVNCLLQ